MSTGLCNLWTLVEKKEIGNGPRFFYLTLLYS